MSETQSPLTTCLINYMLPDEILGTIFEEHAKLKWSAPAIDGQVCRLWRRVVLNTPRAWSYLEISGYGPPRMGELLLWLRRSGAAPLHIQIYWDFTIEGDIKKRTFYDLLGDYHTRITSLQMGVGTLSFFNRRDFPYMQHLDVERWSWAAPLLSSFRWGPMPKLRSLRLGDINQSGTPLDCVPPLDILSLHRANCASLSRHSHSLTTLLLSHVSLGDMISDPMAFPSLTYLSLFNIYGLKPYIHAPHLLAYHEGGYIAKESFSAPLPSLVEYGRHGLSTGVSDPVEWHHSFPNLSRVSIRSQSHLLIPFLASLSIHPYSLPALQTISVKEMDSSFTEADREMMESLVQQRSEACHMAVELCFETKPPFRIPLFLGEVSPCTIRRFVFSDAHSRTQNILFEGCRVLNLPLFNQMRFPSHTKKAFRGHHRVHPHCVSFCCLLFRDPCMTGVARPHHSR